MRVRVVPGKVGYYGLVRRREGDVFDLQPIQTVDFAAVLKEMRSRAARPEDAAVFTDAQAREHVRRNPTAKWPMRTVPVEEQFSSVWMERVDERTPEVTTTAQQAVNKAHDEIRAGRTPGRRESAAA